MNILYSLAIDIGLIALPSWLLLWASPSFRQQFFADFLPNSLYAKFYNTRSNITVPQTVVVAAANPRQQISSIPK
jgi:hypothetical protein